MLGQHFPNCFYRVFCNIYSVTPTMRLYLPCVGARLRGITALWFCRKKGHLHTIPCNEQEWDKELAYNRHFTQYINKSYIKQRTHIDRLRSNPKEKKTTQLLDPRSSQLGSTTDQQEKKQHNGQDLHRAPTWAQLRHLHWYHRHLQLFWKYLWVTGTQQSHTLAIKTI